MNSNNLHTPAEQRLLTALKQVLECRGFSETFDFSIDEYAENRVCLIKANGDWTVFVGERGRKTGLRKFAFLNLACIQVIDYLALDDVSFRKMCSEFNNKTHKYGSASILRSSHPLGATIKASINKVPARVITTKNGKVVSYDKSKTLNQLVGEKRSEDE